MFSLLLQERQKWNQFQYFLLTPGRTQVLIAALASEELLLAGKMHVFAIAFAFLSVTIIMSSPNCTLFDFACMMHMQLDVRKSAHKDNI